MRTSVSSLLRTVLSLSVLGTHADVICNSKYQLYNEQSTAAELAPASPQKIDHEPLEDLCNSQFDDAGFLTHRAGSTVFTITRTNDSNNLESCRDYLKRIVDQCTNEKGYYGGTLLAEGNLYEAYRDESAQVQNAEILSISHQKARLIEATSRVPIKRATQPTAPKKPTTPKAPIAPKIPTTPKNPGSPKTTPKSCPTQPKGKSGKGLRGKTSKRADASNPQCDEDDDLASIWSGIPKTQVS